MKVYRTRFLEVSLVVILSLSTIWILMQWSRASTHCPVVPGAGQPVTGHPQVGDLHVQRDSVSKSHVPVYIVEEHHEVIKYWFGAADKGYIPKTGNVLLHIDGHSDGAPPPLMIGPLFRYPTSSEDITAMMQENDVFIVAAGLTGLLSRVIWVWPTWSTESLEETRGEYASMTLRYGYMYHQDNSTGQQKLKLCGCASSATLGIDNYCAMNTDRESGSQDLGVQIQESQCHIKSTALIETVSETKAISLIKSGTWITEKDSVLLDVDEDFYGVEASITPLIDAGVDDDKIDVVSLWVERFICASNTLQERQADAFYNYLIQTIIDFKLICAMEAKANVSVCKDDHGIISAVKKLQPEFIKNIKQRKLHYYFCDPRSSVFALNQLITAFCKMNIAQLKAFAQVGICLSQSPKTYGFENVRRLRICYGYNTPNNTMVMFHVPTLAEIDQRTDNLKDILKQNQFTPGAVTICRSTRDGYTPKKYFTKIESDVKHALRYAFPGIREDSFYYDEDLLGGPAGWHGRH